jgi:hypothetical protein
VDGARTEAEAQGRVARGLRASPTKPTASPAPATIGALLALQRQAGNRATAALVGKPAGAGGPPAVQRNVLEAIVDVFESDKTLIPKADNGDVDAIHAISDYGALSDERKIKYIGAVLGHGGGTGFRDRRALAHLWGAFGNLYGAAKNNLDLWTQSVEANGDLARMGPFASAEGQFVVEVRNLATSILSSNDQEVIRQFERLGADENGNIRTDLTAKDQARLEAQQKAAAQIVAARDYQQGLRTTVVGYAPPLPDSAAPGDAKVPVTLAMVLDGVVTPTEDAGQGAPKLDEVHHAFDIAQAIERGLLNKWPALYAVAAGRGPQSPWGGPAGPPDPLLGVAGGKSDDARKTMLAALQDTKKHIGEAPAHLSDPELPLDLTLLHPKVMASRGSVFSDPVYKPVVTSIVKGHNEAKAAELLGLTTIAALAFIVAEFATGGLATFLILTGTAASVISSANAVSHAMDVRAVEPTSISDDTAMLEAGTADAATFDAALQTVLSVIDVAAGAKALAGGTKAANELADLDKLAPAEAAAKVEKSLDEVGVAATIAKSGRSADELLRLVGKDSRFAAALRLVPGEIASATGVASATAIARGAKAAEVLARDWAKFTSAEERIGWLETRLNEELTKAGAPEIRIVPKPSPTMGRLEFDPRHYEVSIPLGWFLSARTADEITTLTALAYHEARHAEQWFLIARRLSTLGVSEAEIVTRTGLKADIVKQAAGIPLEAGSAEAAAADAWIKSIATERGQVLRDVAYRDLDAAEADLVQAKKAMKEAEESRDAAKIKDAKNNLEDAQVKYDACEEQYRKLPEELDAYGVSQAIENAARALREGPPTLPRGAGP